MNKFLPGDRVRIINRPYAWLNHQLGTVVPSDSKDFPIAVKFDNEKNFPEHPSWPDGTRRWSVDYANQHLEHAPIEPHCWVRYPVTPFGLDYVGKVVSINNTVAYVDFKEFRPNHQSVPISELIRIADPEPFVSSADRSVSINLSTVDHLKQAQQLAQAIHAKHFNDEPNQWRVADDLTTVLLQIDNMTAGLVRESTSHSILTTLNAQLDILAEFIRVNHPQSIHGVSTIDTAIAVMEMQHDLVQTRNAALNTAADLLKEWLYMFPQKSFGSKTRAWLDQFFPQAPLQRGETVTWGVGHVRARIVDMSDPENVEVISTQQRDSFDNASFLFTRHKLSDLRRPTEPVPAGRPVP